MIVILNPWTWAIIAFICFFCSGFHTTDDVEPWEYEEHKREANKPKPKPKRWQVWLSENQSDVFVISVSVIAIIAGFIFVA